MTLTMKTTSSTQSCEEHFSDPISHETTNWALKGNNLRKLLRNLESYFHTTLHKTTNFQSLSDSISSIAREQGGFKENIAEFIEVIVGAAVTCEDRGRYIGWIMGMGEENQVLMKAIIESSLARLEDMDVNDSRTGASSAGDDGDDYEISDDEDFEGGAEMSGLFRNAMQNLDSATEGIDVDFTLDSNSHAELMSPASHAHSHFNASMDVMKEREDLKAALAEAKRELAAQKSNAVTLAEDSEVTQKKLRALATDLQERLERRQEELLETETNLMRAKRALEDAEGKVSDLSEQNATLEDELDIAKAKAMQLKKAEATVVSYRKKLEGAGVMNQQMTDLENQSAKYLSQIVELEMEAKKIPELQKNLDTTTRELKKVQKEKNDFEDKVVTRTSEIAKLKTELSATVSAKKVAEEELNELRLMQEPDYQRVDDGPSIGGLSLTSAQSVTEVREKVIRLEIENKKLKKKIEESTAAADAAAGATPAVTVDAKTYGDGTDVQVLQVEIQKLRAELKKKDAATVKLASDKDKLEAYTKRTLSKFQEKYLVALQECKAKLKEKHDKIEALELRSAAEKSNQKKEEKLLSSTIYELGLTIMQQKLKGR